MSNTGPLAASLYRRHLRFGWWSLLVFLTLGFALETLHGFKVGWYLDVADETRRLMWTLAHAHGTLLSVLHLVFAATACGPLPRPAAWRRRASACLFGATVLLPGGFFLGGVFVYDGDPGLGVLLVPAGALLLWVAVLLTARGVASSQDAAPGNPHPDPLPPLHTRPSGEGAAARPESGKKEVAGV
jgi:hypothetical protein